MLTCLSDAFYPQVGLAAVECIERLGWRVAFEEAQTCCGQPAFNAGDRAAALKVARHTLDVFERAEHVVVPSGSCAAMLRWGYPQLFDNQPDAERARRLGERTWELSEFLTRACEGRWPGRLRRRVVFHRSCHMRELSADARPEALLQSIPGMEVVAPATAEQCCGFGGTFSVGFPWISGQMAGEKLAAFRSVDADEWVTSDMGCLMHLDGIRRRQSGAANVAPFRHYIELLRESLDTMETADAR
jgi:L-lactate dehydrogenase complex protein LldE